MMFVCPTLYALDLVGLEFFSHGIHKTESLFFIDDSLCVYKQMWDNGLFEETSQYADTFVYTDIGSPQKGINNVIIHTTNLRDSVSWQRPINNKYYQIMNIRIPKTIWYFDREADIMLYGKNRRSNYDMWDMPVYPGKKSFLADSYAILFNIATDTLWICDNQVVRFNSTNIKLYSPDTLCTQSQTSLSIPTQMWLSEKLESYEYKRYRYFMDKDSVSKIEKDMLIGQMFYYDSPKNRDETLFFVNDSCCLYRRYYDSIAQNYFYEIKNNQIIIKRMTLDNMNTNSINTDTLVYNNGFIFYSKIELFDFSLSEFVLNTKIFHQHNINQSSTHGLKGNLFQRKRKYYPEYDDFSNISYNTYIPINLPDNYWIYLSN